MDTIQGWSGIRRFKGHAIGAQAFKLKGMLSYEELNIECVVYHVTGNIIRVFADLFQSTDTQDDSNM